MYEELVNRLRDADKSLHTALMLLDEKLKAIYPRWVSVQEALPDQNDGGLYICHIVGGDYDQFSWFELCDFAEGRFWTHDSMNDCHVTHWMPLPPAPETDE